MKFWTLLPDWVTVMKSSWTVRLAFLSALLSALEFGLPYIAPTKNSGWFALLATVVSLLAAIARVVAQPKMLATLLGKKAERESQL